MSRPASPKRRNVNERLRLQCAPPRATCGAPCRRGKRWGGSRGGAPAVHEVEHGGPLELLEELALGLLEAGRALGARLNGKRRHVRHTPFPERRFRHGTVCYTRGTPRADHPVLDPLFRWQPALMAS